jgi:hypothetical protein
MLSQTELDSVLLVQGHGQSEMGNYRIACHRKRIDNLSKMLGQRIPKPNYYYRRTTRVKVVCPASKGKR